MRYTVWPLLIVVVGLAVAGCTLTRDSVSSAELDGLRDKAGPPMYFAGESFGGLPLTEAQSWDSDAGEAFFAYGTCEPPEGEGGCPVPAGMQHFAFRRSDWDRAEGCSRLRSLRGVPTARHDGLVLFTGSIVVKVYARDAAEDRRVVAELRGLNNALGPGES